MYFGCPHTNADRSTGHHTTPHRRCRSSRYLHLVIDFLTAAIGSDYTIEWDDVTGATVNIDLGDGPSGDVAIVLNIATGIANSGVHHSILPPGADIR
jgi:hypothetical protein